MHYKRYTTITYSTNMWKELFIIFLSENYFYGGKTRFYCPTFLFKDRFVSDHDKIEFKTLLLSFISMFIGNQFT